MNRKTVTNSLTRLVIEKDKHATLSSRFRADFLFREMIHDRLMNGNFDYELGYDIPAENQVREFFKLEPLEYYPNDKEKIPF